MGGWVEAAADWETQPGRCSVVSAREKLAEVRVVCARSAHVIPGAAGPSSSEQSPLPVSSQLAAREQPGNMISQPVLDSHHIPTDSPFCTATEDLVKAFQSKPEGVSSMCMPSVSVDTNPVSAAHANVSNGADKNAPLKPNLTVELLSPTHLTTIVSVGVSSHLTPNGSLRVGTFDSSLAGSGALGCPPHGVKAVCGKRAKMEDTFVVQVNYFNLPASVEEVQCDKLPPRLATCTPDSPLSTSPPNSGTQTPSSVLPSPSGQCCSGLMNTPLDGSSMNSENLAASHDLLHFFGVYDGHGGAEAAQHCASRLHYHLAEALVCVSSQINDGCHHTECPVCKMDTDENYENPQVGSSPINISKGATTTDALASSPSGEESTVAINSPSALSAPARQQNRTTSPTHAGLPVASNLSDCFDCTRSSSSSSLHSSETPSVSALLEEALRNAFLKTDTEFGSETVASTVGSTAVVALLGKRRMWIANCGDSRAVLCRGGRAIQLTDDHKPEREDEAERVEKAGGQVLFWNGHRVMGVLAMSRAIGDHGLRPYVIAEPEISVLQRTEDDEFMLLASDGLWDVMSNQEATHLAKRCITRAREKGASCKAAVRVAASVLTSAAIDRGSKDNVTVVIVDLKSNKSGSAPAAAVHDGLVVELAPTTPKGAEDAVMTEAAPVPSIGVA
eukprot:gene8233-1499_t